MPNLRIHYELSSIACDGERVGVDWTFFIHTGAGLVSFDAALAPGATNSRVRLLGVRDVDPEASEPSDPHERELWWASATEHDTAVPEHGIGVFTPVWIPLEPNVEVHRCLAVDVVEAKRWTRPGRVAHLRLEVRARVEALTHDSAPPPALDATPLVPDASVPKPGRTAGELPLGFEVVLEGVESDESGNGRGNGNSRDGEVTVHATRIVLVDRQTPPAEGSDPRAAPLHELLVQLDRATSNPGFAGATLLGHEPSAALYELRNRDGEPFWIGGNSSMGIRNNHRIIEAFAHAAAPTGSVITDELGGFETRSSLLVELLAQVPTAELGPTATAIAELIAALILQHPERATVEREIYVRTAILDAHTGEWTYAFIVDPRPYSGPDPLAWLVVWTDAWSE